MVEMTTKGSQVLPLDEEYLTPGELASLIRREKKTLAVWRAAGSGPPFAKLGGRILYPRGSVDRWIADNMSQQDTTAENNVA